MANKEKLFNPIDKRTKSQSDENDNKEKVYDIRRSRTDPGGLQQRRREPERRAGGCTSYGWYRRGADTCVRTHAADLGGEASGIFFQDADETVTFCAYYPYDEDSNEESLPGEEGIITDVTTTDQTKQSSFDFLFATGATASKSQSTVSFNNTVKENTSFTHRMTRLVLNITTDANAGFTASDVAQGTYSLSGIKHSGTFNTQNGTAIATGDPTPDWKITAANTGAGDEFTYSMILYPQNVASLTFKATINGQDYTCELTPALAAATSYTYNITVKKTKLEVSNCEIADWGSGATVDIEAK